MAKFEFAVYNAEVRQKVADGERHSRFTDDWADLRYIEIEADNEEQARALVEVMHPSVQGFVIDEILERWKFRINPGEMWRVWDPFLFRKPCSTP